MPWRLDYFSLAHEPKVDKKTAEVASLAPGVPKKKCFFRPNPPIEQQQIFLRCMGVSENSGTPKSSNLIGFSIINHPCWGTTIFGNTHIALYDQNNSRFYLNEDKEAFQKQNIRLV